MHAGDDTLLWIAGAVLVLGLRQNALELSQTATGLSNDPPVSSWIPLARLRLALASLPDGTTWTSGYRGDPVNDAVGGVASSKHLEGLAIDVIPPRQMPRARFASLVRASGWWSEVLDELDHFHLSLA